MCVFVWLECSNSLVHIPPSRRIWPFSSVSNNKFTSHGWCNITVGLHYSSQVLHLFCRSVNKPFASGTQTCVVAYCTPSRVVPYLRRLVRDFPPRRPGFNPRSGHMGSVVDKVALGQVFSEYFGFPCQFSFNQLLNTHHLVTDVPSGLSLTPPQEA
jgi:hypothetical protein